MTLKPETEMPLPLFDIDELEQSVARLHSEYDAAQPYPHIVIDNFLSPEAVTAAISEFPPLNQEQWTNYLHVNERKFSNTDPTTWGPTLQRILEEFNSLRFVEFIGRLLGVDDLIADPSLEGGGLHQSTRGGFLNIHADFTVHPHHRTWQRRDNIPLVPERGLETRIRRRPRIVECRHEGLRREGQPDRESGPDLHDDATSFHGHPEPMRCPEGVARRSLALTTSRLRRTQWSAQPTTALDPETARCGILIYGDKQMLRAYDWAKRRLGISDRVVSKLLGYRDRVRRKDT